MNGKVRAALHVVADEPRQRALPEARAELPRSAADDRRPAADPRGHAGGAGRHQGRRKHTAV